MTNSKGGTVMCDKSYPFECENCGNKPTPREVLDNDGECSVCKDIIIAYTIDTAECILRIEENGDG